MVATTRRAATSMTLMSPPVSLVTNTRPADPGTAAGASAGDGWRSPEQEAASTAIASRPPLGRYNRDAMKVPFQLAILLAAVGAGIVLLPDAASAHGVANRDAAFVQSIDGAAIGPFLYLGAKHMVTGYDHLLFLVGVIFFLYRLRDVLVYVSLFTLGHSLTLLAGVLGNIQANAYVIDAIIGLSVVYKAFENLGGFERVLGFRPNTRAAVMIFGLFHGFGLATKLQELALPQDGLVANIVSFNVGVEIGQFLALTGVLIGISYWRTRPGFLRHSFAANTALMAGGFILMGYQLTGYFRS